MADGTRNKQISRDVFKWIKRKSQPSTPNLIRNCEGHIIYEPNLALDYINDQWDAIFSSNVLHQNPEDILKFIWPQIQQARIVASVPP